jgi:hypothetical protein
MLNDGNTVARWRAAWPAVSEIAASMPDYPALRQCVDARRQGQVQGIPTLPAVAPAVTATADHSHGGTTPSCAFGL